MTPQLCPVRVKNNLIFTRLLNSNRVVGEGLARMKVEAEDTSCPLKHNDLVVLVLGGHVAWIRPKPSLLLLQMVHGSIKLVETSVEKIAIVHQVPLSSSVVITLSISHAGKVQPLRMSKLVTNEVKISFS